MKRYIISFILFGFLNLSQATLSEEEVTLTVRVDAGKSECLFLPVLKTTYKVIELNYLVARGGDNDITLTLRKPSGQYAVSDVQSRTNSHRIDVGAEDLGDYILCMDNSFSFVSSKTVAISFYLLDENGNYFGDLNKINANPAMEVLIATQVFDSATTQIKLNLNHIENEMNHMRSITLKDRSRAEDNFEDVNFWGVVNTLVMISATLCQVFLIRSLLTDNSKVGKLLRGGFKSD